VDSQLNSRGFALLAVAIAWAAFLTVIGSPEVILFTVPVFMLAAPLALGRYLGEELIAAIAHAIRPPRPSSFAVPTGTSRAVSSFFSGPPLAGNRAGRAPPLTFA
jgi:hypothetical protein